MTYFSLDFRSLLGTVQKRYWWLYFRCPGHSSSAGDWWFWKLDALACIHSPASAPAGYYPSLSFPLCLFKLTLPKLEWQWLQTTNFEKRNEYSFIRHRLQLHLSFRKLISSISSIQVTANLRNALLTRVQAPGTQRCCHAVSPCSWHAVNRIASMSYTFKKKVQIRPNNATL